MYAVVDCMQVFSPTGPLNRDQDDVRRVYDAAVEGTKRYVQRFALTLIGIRT